MLKLGNSVGSTDGSALRLGTFDGKALGFKLLLGEELGVDDGS